MDIASNPVLLIHILLGCTALLVGIIPMIAAKGRTLHIYSGRVYVQLMTGLFITALVLTVFRINYFLLASAFFSYYLTLTSYIYINLHRGVHLTASHKTVFFCGLAGSVLMALYGFFLYFSDPISATVLVLFGGIWLLSARYDYLRFLKKKMPDSPDAENRDSYFYEHLARAIGSYVATFTAFAVNNLKFIPVLVSWIFPTLAGIIIINRVSVYYSKQKKNR